MLLPATGRRGIFTARGRCQYGAGEKHWHSMEIRLGAEVRGTEDRLGGVHRFIADARIATVTDLVVEHGHLSGQERVVPLAKVTQVDGGAVVHDRDEPHFTVLDGYTDEPLHAPYTNYAALRDSTMAPSPSMRW
jgi:hypothetical protein